MSNEQKVVDAIVNNNLSLFKYLHNNKRFSINNLTYNPLLVACENESWDIAEYIISITNFWTNGINQSGNTALSYALHMGKIDFAFMLTDYGFTNFNQRNNEGFLAVNYLRDNDSITHELLERILKRSERIVEPIMKFQIYNNLNTDLKDMSTGGTYGSLFYDSISGSMVKMSREELLIPNLVREMIFLKMINSINPYIAVHLKGVYHDGINFGIVIESLTYSLKDVFNLYRDIDISSKCDYYKSIYLTLLETIDKMHVIGILHRDLKPLNVMIDCEGHIRIIDFGIAEYIGIKPDQLEFIGTENYTAPDSGKYISLRLVTEKIILPSNKRNYSSDIFSFGSIILCSLFNDDFCLYFSGDNIYEYKQGPNKNLVIKKLSKQKIDIINSFSPYLMDLLKLTFEVDSNLRINAKELLLHPFFTGNEYKEESVILRSISLIDFPKFSNDDILLNRGPLKYGNDIYDVIKEQKICKTNISTENLQELKEKYDSYNLKNDDFDIIFNRNIMLTSVDHTFDSSIYKIIFKGQYPDITDKTKETINNVIGVMDSLFPISIVSFIEYYITRLQMIGIISSIIMYFRINAYDKFYEYSISKREEDVTVEDLMKVIIDDISSEKNIQLPIL